MRTTVEFDEESTRAIEELRRREGIGVSDAVNRLVHIALLPRPDAPAFRLPTTALGLKVDVSDIEAALETVEGPSHR